MINVLRTINPVTRILGLALVTTPLLISVDIVSAAVALGFTFLLAPVCGMSWWALIRRGWPVFLAAPIAAISMALYGRPEGKVYAEFLFAHVTDNSLNLAAAIFLRVLAVGLPVMLLTAKMDPTDLGDGLAQILKLPERFVIGAVAGARLTGLFRRDWDSLARARRARGVGDSGRIKRLATMSFGLLVLSLRRGGTLATAMETRGFGRYGKRTWARESQLHGIDALVLLSCAAISATAIAVAVYTGHFRFLGA